MLNTKPQVKNIIFDLGGVLIGINYQLTSKAFQKLGILNFDAVYTQYKQTELFDLFETGKISPDVFRQTVKNNFGVDISDDEFDRAWNAMILKFPNGIISTLSKLAQQYRIFLFSNTNTIHLEKVYEITTQQKLSHWDQFFEKTYYSHQFGYRKPYPESFQALLKDSDLLAQETLFIDDSIQHIEGAQKVNIHTFHMPKNKNITDFVT